MPGRGLSYSDSESLVSGRHESVAGRRDRRCRRLSHHVLLAAAGLEDRARARHARDLVPSQPGKRGRGRLPDWITGGAPFEIGAVQAVGFDASAPEIGAFLREYWRHVVFRKTLTPLHGVFRGYQTMLALYAFTKWAAKLGALRGGRASVTIGDVKDAVRLIEQRFVLHARFADVFTLSPVLTVMADRLFQDPAFVRGAVLEPEHP